MRNISDRNDFYTIIKKMNFYPPWRKCVKKIYECSVKKENLFELYYSFVSFLFQKVTKT